MTLTYAMRHTVHIKACPVLLNDILRTPARHQSRLKVNGKRGKRGNPDKLGYDGLRPYLDKLPSFSVPVDITLTIYQTRRNPIDIDSVNKTLLDAMKRHGTIIDDNHEGVGSMTVRYARGFHERKTVKVSVKPVRGIET